MERIVHRISLDAQRNGVQKVLQGFQTGDKYARRIEVRMVSGTETLDIDNSTAVMYVEKPSGEQSVNACQIENGRIIYDVQPSDTIEEGSVIMQLKVVSIDNVVVTPRFALEVWESDASDTEAIATQTFTALEKAIAEAKALSDSAIVRSYIDEDMMFVIEYANGSKYESNVMQQALKYIGSDKISEIVSETAREYVATHAEEFRGEKGDVGSPGIWYYDTYPSNPEDYPIWMPPGDKGSGDELLSELIEKIAEEKLDSVKSELVGKDEVDNMTIAKADGKYSVSEKIATVEVEEITRYLTPIETINGYSYNTSSVGKAVNKTSRNIQDGAKYEVIGGQKITVSCSFLTNSYSCGYIIADADNKSIEMFFDASANNWVTADIEVEMPSNAKYLYVNKNISQGNPTASVTEVGEVVKPTFFNKEEYFDNLSLTNIGEYAINALSYRPLGALSKGYICFNCDDGDETLATYTIPYLKTKNIPCTFNLVSNCISVRNYSELIKEMVNDYGCSVAFHGSESWTEYSEKELVEFVNSERQAYAEKGIYPKGAVCPNHQYNNMVSVVMGGLCDGIVCTGGVEKAIKYPSGTVGERSNLFAIYRCSIDYSSDDFLRLAVDYAYDNNKILLPWWHDKSLASSAELQGKLDRLIDYAKSKGIAFTTIGEIPNLI